MCRRAVQDQLAELQRLGFIRVEKMPRRGGRLPSNRYRLACEPDFSPTSKEDSAEQTPPKSSPLAKSAQGKKDPSPWANSSENLGQNLPPKLVSETKNKTRPQAPSGRMRWFCLTDDDVGSSGWGDWFLANNLPKLSDIPSLKKDAQRGEYMLPSRFPPTEREDVENALAYLANVGGVYPSPPEKVGVE